MHGLETLSGVFSLAELGVKNAESWLTWDVELTPCFAGAPLTPPIERKWARRGTAGALPSDRRRDSRATCAFPRRSRCGVPLKRVAQKELVSLATISRALKRSRQ